MTTRFRDLNPLGRAAIVAIAALTFGIATVAFVTSYDALYEWVSAQQLYSERVNRIWPLLLDAGFIVAQLAAILAGIMRAALGGSRDVHRGWPVTVMVLCGGLTVWFNVLHADAGGATWARRLTAALPPVLMMLAFEVDVSIVRWVMAALGRPLDGALSPTAAGWPLPLGGAMPGGMVGGAVPGQLYRPAGGDMMPQVPTGQDGQNGHGSSKREQVQAYLATLTPEQLALATRSSVAKAMRAGGVHVSEAHVSEVLGQFRAQLPAGQRRRRR